VLAGILASIGLWLLVFVPSGAAGSLAAGRLGLKPILAGSVTQASFAALSIVAACLVFPRPLEGLGLAPSGARLVEAALVAVGVAAALLALESLLLASLDYEPPFAPRSWAELVAVAVVLAPLGEETLYRGLVEGYLLQHASLWVAVAEPALLFSLMHIAPFRGAPRAYTVFVLSFALVVGLIAGYYRAYTGSLAAPVTVHALANLVGNTRYMLASRRGSGGGGGCLAGRG
jgi:membrane protease YdiL (CAAX protease family)